MSPTASTEVAGAVEIQHEVDAYAHQVVSGAILAGKYHRLACQRHLRDRSREGSPDFPFVFDIERARRFFRFAARLKHYKGKQWARKPIELTPVQQFRLGSIFGWVHRETGRRRFTRAYNELPRKHGKTLEAAIIAVYVTFFDGEPGAEGYCLHPKTDILMADLSWKELQDVEVGDKVFAVDEHVVGFRKHRKMRVATVLGKVRHRRPAVRVTLDTGAEVVCSPDHKWLSQSPASGNFKWRATRDLRAGYRISYIGEPWLPARSWDAGYLAGLFDGEGYVFQGERCAFQIGFSQKPGAVLDACVSTLRKLGFAPTEPYPHAGGTMQLTVPGLYQCIRLLGQIKPVRLWAKARQLWEGKKAPSTTVRITRIERVGYEELIDIETSARTFVAEGLVSHNCVATKRQQAKLVFDAARQLVRSSGLRNRITVFAHNMHRESQQQKLEPLGADADSTDGLNPYLIITDEYHAHKQRDLVDVMESATGARLSFLHFIITTAGDDPVSPCGDEHDYVCKILDGVLHDDATEATFGFIAHADPEDDWLDEQTWRKANPHYGVSVNPEDLRKLALKAKNMPSAVAEFKQKRLGIWVNSSQPWLSMDGWRAGQSGLEGRPHWHPDEMVHESCWIGVDLASMLDLAALVAVFPPTATRTTWRLLRFVWTPQDTLRERARRDRAAYETWAAERPEGEAHLRSLIPVEGVRINHGRVIRPLLQQLRERYRIEQIGFDPWHADQVVDDLVDEDGFSQEQCILVPQTYAGMSAAALSFEAAVLEGIVDANGCPLMLWCASNVVVQKDGKDNIYPVKKKSRGRIDPIMASIIGWRLASLGETTQKKGKRGRASVWTPQGFVPASGTHGAPDAGRSAHV